MSPLLLLLGLGAAFALFFNDSSEYVGELIEEDPAFPEGSDEEIDPPTEEEVDPSDEEEEGEPPSEEGDGEPPSEEGDNPPTEEEEVDPPVEEEVDPSDEEEEGEPPSEEGDNPPAEEEEVDPPTGEEVDPSDEEEEGEPPSEEGDNPPTEEEEVDPPVEEEVDPSDEEEDNPPAEGEEVDPPTGEEAAPINPFAVPKPEIELMDVDLGNDTVFAQVYETDVVQQLDNAVEDGSLSEEEYNDILANKQVLDGPLAINTGEGQDLVLGSKGDDYIFVSNGADVAFGGAGDDYIDLGNNDPKNEYDISGNYPSNMDDKGNVTGNLDPLIEREFSLGDDTIAGNEGRYWIKDGYGHNLLTARMGGDYINAVDLDELSPDTISAGWGHDRIEVDEGDLLSVSNGNDEITIHLHAQNMDQDFQPVRVVDFKPTEDAIKITGSYIDEMVQSFGSVDNIPLTIVDLENGDDAVLSVNGIDVAILMGGQGLEASDITIIN